MKINTTIIFASILYFNVNGFSQTATEFNSGLSTLTQNVANKINDTNIIKIAVWDFTDLNGQVTTLGKYISEETQVNFLNVGKDFQIINRNHLTQILKEHKLNSSEVGIIDQNTAKELGKIQAVDAIITGTVTILNDKIKVTMQVLNTETAATIAGAKAEFLMNDDIKILLGMSVYDNSGTISTSNAGLKAGENEVYNDDKLVNNDCSTTNTGDYCFNNTTKFNMFIILQQDGGEKLAFSKLVKAGQAICFYSLFPMRYTYIISYNPQYPDTELTSGFGNTLRRSNFHEGAMFVEQCKSKTYSIK